MMLRSILYSSPMAPRGQTQVNFVDIFKLGVKYNSKIKMQSFTGLGWCLLGPIISDWWTQWEDPVRRRRRRHPQPRHTPRLWRNQCHDSLSQVWPHNVGPTYLIMGLQHVTHYVIRTLGNIVTGNDSQTDAVLAAQVILLLANINSSGCDVFASLNL